MASEAEAKPWMPRGFATDRNKAYEMVGRGLPWRDKPSA